MEVETLVYTIQLNKFSSLVINYISKIYSCTIQTDFIT